jgi:hypothetical protein
VPDSLSTVSAAYSSASSDRASDGPLLLVRPPRLMTIVFLLQRLDPICRTPLQRDTYKETEDRPQTEQKSALDGDGISTRSSRTRISAGVPDQCRRLWSIRGDRCAAGGRVPANRAGSATRT